MKGRQLAGDEHESNLFAAPETDFHAPDQTLKTPEWIYASFGQRLVAHFVDLMLIFILFGAAAEMIDMGDDGMSDPGSMPKRAAVIAILTVIPWLYFAIQECSATQATLGKRMLGLKVIDLAGARISFARASVRYLGRIFALLVLIAAAVFTNHSKQNSFAGILVAVPLLLFYLGYLVQLVTKHRQTFHDMISGCLVIRNSGDQTTPE